MVLFIQKIQNSVLFNSSFIKRWGFVVFAIVFYIAGAAYYMGPGFYHCTDSLYGFGDSTAGPIWRNSLSPAQPLLGGYEKATNFPFGESLYSPVNYAGVVQTASIALTSKVAGPVCGYNLSNIFGYLTTAMIMFAFIWYLTKSRWIGLLAGYAVAFTPYVQSKIGGHPSYAYASLLIAIVWLTLHVIKRKKLWHAGILALALATCAYFDPYFILLAGTAIMPILLIWAVNASWRIFVKHESKQETLDVVKALAIAFGIFLVLVLPLIYVRVSDSKLINSSVGGVRGNITESARIYSNQPLDYLLPDSGNILLPHLFGPGYAASNISHRHCLSAGECRVSISLTALTVISLGLIVIAWEVLNRRHTGLATFLAYNPKIILGSIIGIAFLAFSIGLPPHYMGLTTPDGLIIKLTQTWRVFAREYLVLNMAVIILFAIVLKYFSSIAAIRKYRLLMAGIFIAIFGLVVAEYQINLPFHPPVFSYSRDVPPIYYQIRDDKSINALAEYPLDRSGVEYDSIVYYLTMQKVHGKSLFNSAALVDKDLNIHLALRDLSDPQTIPALRELGIKYVVIHGVPSQTILTKTDQLQILSDTMTGGLFSSLRASGSNDIVLAKILDGPKINSILTIDKGLGINLQTITSPLNSVYEVFQDAQLKVTPLNGKSTAGLENQCFDVRSVIAGEVESLTISVNGLPIQTTHLTGDYATIRVRVNDGDTIMLHNSDGHDMVLDNLGCGNLNLDAGVR